MNPKKHRLIKRWVLVLMCTTLLLGSVKPKKVEALAISSTVLYLGLTALGLLGYSMAVSDPDKAIAVGKEMITDTYKMVESLLVNSTHFVGFLNANSADIGILDVGHEVPNSLIIGATTAILQDTINGSYQFLPQTNEVQILANNYHSTSANYRTTSRLPYYSYYANSLATSYEYYNDFYLNMKTNFPKEVLFTAGQLALINHNTVITNFNTISSNISNGTATLKTTTSYTSSSNILRYFNKDNQLVNFTIPNVNLNYLYSDLVAYGGYLYSVLYNTGLAEGVYSIVPSAVYETNPVTAFVEHGTLFIPQLFTMTENNSYIIHAPITETLYRTIPNAKPINVYNPNVHRAPTIDINNPNITIEDVPNIVNSTITKPLVIPNQNALDTAVAGGLTQTGKDKTTINNGVILAGLLANAGAIDKPSITMPDVVDSAFELPSFPTFGTEFPSLGDILTGAGISALFAWLGERIVSPLAWMGSLIAGSIANIWTNIKNFFATAIDTVLSALSAIGQAILDIPAVIGDVLDGVLALPQTIANSFTLMLSNLFELDSVSVKAKIDSLVINFKNRFPIFEDLMTMFRNVTNSITTPTPPNFSITLPAFMGGTTHNVFDVTIIDPYMNTFRTLTSVFTWLFFGWRFTRRITSIKT